MPVASGRSTFTPECFRLHSTKPETNTSEPENRIPKQHFYQIGMLPPSPAPPAMLSLKLKRL
ncbi:hypothetical protein [Microcoleus sp. B4-D4]|uniref:hypothetical protein n=1 Tax=Microcoleus sp. B4-D4 TaxID=2818667 RepID=UPI002FD1639A